jgi:hypothetical protein
VIVVHVKNQSWQAVAPAEDNLIVPRPSLPVAVPLVAPDLPPLVPIFVDQALPSQVAPQTPYVFAPASTPARGRRKLSVSKEIPNPAFHFAVSGRNSPIPSLSDSGAARAQLTQSAMDVDPTPPS